MKIRFYIFSIVCVFLTCSFASAEWAKFSDYENNGGCGFDTCQTDAQCNAGQCHFCDLSSGTNGNGICKKGSEYDGKDYGSYEKCKCASRKREWATTENKCCPKGEYNSDGHCCKKDNNDDTKTEVWCEITQKCQSKKESCCPDGSVWDTSDEAKSYNGHEGECCWENDWKKNEYGAECCSYIPIGNKWNSQKTPVCEKAYCIDTKGTWDTSEGAKYARTTEGGCCPNGMWKQNEYGTECCTNKRNHWWTNVVTPTPVCAKAYCDKYKGIWDTSEYAKKNTDNGTSEGACCIDSDYGTWTENEYGTECCQGDNNRWMQTKTPVCAKASCAKQGKDWDSSNEAKASLYGTSAGACCLSIWTGTECCSVSRGRSSNAWTGEITAACCAEINKTLAYNSNGKPYCR